MTTATKTPADYAATIRAMILQDVINGQVPADVTSFEALHDHVDANEYLIDAGVPWEIGEDGMTDLGPTNDTTDLVHEWLQGGGIVRDMPTRPAKINRTRLANEGATYARGWLGTLVAVEDSSGTRYLGRVDGFGWSDSQRSLAGYPIVKLADGRWMRVDGFTLQVAR